MSDTGLMVLWLLDLLTFYIFNSFLLYMSVCLWQCKCCFNKKTKCSVNPKFSFHYTPPTPPPHPPPETANRVLVGYTVFSISAIQKNSVNIWQLLSDFVILTITCLYVLWLKEVHILWNQLLLELSVDLFNTLQICYRHTEDVHEEVLCRKNTFWQTYRVFNLAIFQWLHLVSDGW